jgi:mannose/fructose/N-acetylgalactosamine-specific phosphotransferase system component IID
MDTIFWICVQIMIKASSFLGITYQQLNVILFVILHPAITLLLFYFFIRYKRKYEAIKDAVKP